MRHRLSRNGRGFLEMVLSKFSDDTIFLYGEYRRRVAKRQHLANQNGELL
jgi:hypothetical protein